MQRFPYLGGLPERPFAVPGTTGTTWPEPSVFDGTPSLPYLLTKEVLESVFSYRREVTYRHRVRSGAQQRPVPLGRGQQRGE